MDFDPRLPLMSTICPVQTMHFNGTLCIAQLGHHAPPLLRKQYLWVRPVTIMGEQVISRIGHCTQGASANSFSVSSFAKIVVKMFFLAWLAT